MRINLQYNVRRKGGLGGRGLGGVHIRGVVGMGKGWGEGLTL